MPRMLMVTTVPSTFWFLLPFADRLRDSGWTVDALTSSVGEFPHPGHFDSVVRVEWSRNPIDARHVLNAPGRVRAIVAERDYDLVHVHTPVAAFITRFALRHRRRSKPRVIYTAHGFHFHPGGRLWSNAAFIALEKVAGRWTDYLVVMNREDLAAAAHHRLVPSDRLRVMPGVGVDLSRYAPEQVDSAKVSELRRSLGIGEDPYFLMVAEFIPRKRHRDLLRAFADIAADATLPRAHLLFAGSGAMVEESRAMARALRLEGRAHFLGLRQDVPVLMRAAAALVLPSEQEGLPRSVLEAMSMGLTTIGTRIRGTAELLEDGCGYLYDVGDTAALAALLRGVLRDAHSAQAVATRARQRVARYDERNVVRLHEELYAEALGLEDDGAR